MTDISDDTIMAYLEAIRTELAHQTEDLAEIKTEAKLTNGRVKSLELWKARLDGAAGALSWRTPLVLGLVIALVTAVSTVALDLFIHL